MRRNWGYVKNGGAWTIWEAIWYTQNQTGQLCQGWGCAPLIAMAHRILGVRPSPGRPQEVLIAPTTASLTYARGAVAHPAGPIEVDCGCTGRGSRGVVERAGGERAGRGSASASPPRGRWRHPGEGQRDRRPEGVNS